MKFRPLRYVYASIWDGQKSGIQGVYAIRWNPLLFLLFRYCEESICGCRLHWGTNFAIVFHNTGGSNKPGFEWSSHLSKFYILLPQNNFFFGGCGVGDPKIRCAHTCFIFYCLMFHNLCLCQLELEYCCVKSVNRRNGKSMRRVWVHGKFQKPVWNEVIWSGLSCWDAAVWRNHAAFFYNVACCEQLFRYMYVRKVQIWGSIEFLRRAVKASDQIS